MCDILWIEDDQIEAKLLVSQLTKLNPKHTQSVTICNTEQHFYKIINENQFDIILCDYKLGLDFTGKDVIEYLQKKNIETPVVIVTGAIGEEKTAELMKIGAADLVLKTNIDKLDQIIDRELKNVFYKVDQIKIMEKVNLILFKLAKAVNWIMQNPLDQISFNRILKDFGELLNVDRSYIFERIHFKTSCFYELKYLWCQVNDCEIKDCNKQNLHCIDFRHKDCDTNSVVINHIENKKHIYGISKTFDEISKKDLLDNHILSFAAFPILKPNKEVWGFLGFDDCNRERIWTELEINTLNILSAILGTIVYKIEIKNKEDFLINEQVVLLRNARDSIMTYLSKKGGDRHGDK